MVILDALEFNTVELKILYRLQYYYWRVEKNQVLRVCDLLCIEEHRIRYQNGTLRYQIRESLLVLDNLI